MDGFSGIWSFFLPQYFTNAILLGDAQVTLPFSTDFEYAFGIKFCSVIYSVSKDKDNNFTIVL